jgi:phenylpyruvate tautomerase PptA (4-oxalocrotonate tautomerase family)
MTINIEPHKATPPETTKEQKRRIQDEITRQIAEYLAKGNTIKEIPTGLGAGNSERSF